MNFTTIILSHKALEELIVKSYSIEMYAKNSSGIQKLYLNMDGDDPFFMLAGDYRGDHIQIDFDVTSRVDLLKMKQMLEIALSNES